MKKITLFAALLISISCFSQKVALSPSGLVSESDKTKSFVVVDVEGKTAAEMYTNLFNYIQKSYNSPGDVIKSKVQDSFIHYDTHLNQLLLAKMGMTSGVYDLTYRTEVEFKDGRAKISFTDLRFSADSPGNKYKLNLQGGTFDGYVIFNKKGEVKDEASKLKMELTFNEAIEQLKAILSGAAAKSSQEGW